MQSKTTSNLLIVFFFYSKGFIGGFLIGFSKKKAYKGIFKASAIFLKRTMLIVCITLVASKLAIIDALVPDNSASFSWLILPYSSVFSLEQLLFIL